MTGYLAGVSRRQGANWLDDELDRWAEDADFPSWPLVAITAGSPPTDRAVQRLRRLREAGRLPDLQPHAFSAVWALDSSEDTFLALIDDVLLAASPEAIEPALELLAYRLGEGALSEGRAEPLMWRCLETRPGSAWSSVMGRHYWTELAQRLVHSGPARVAQAFVSAADPTRVYLNERDDLAQVLVAATTADPRTVWGIVADHLRPDNLSLRLLLGLRGWYGRHVGKDVLIEWAESNPPHGPGVAAETCPVHGIPLEDPARSLLIQFDNDEVRSALSANLRSGVFVGPLSGSLEGHLRMAEAWCSDPEPAVQRWASALRRSLLEELPSARQWDEEQELL